MVSSVLTVSQLNAFVKSLIETDGRLNDFFLSGEISNFTDHYRSGHLYFSLKDEKAVVKAVMFAQAAKRLRFRPQDGMKVIVRGRVSVYEASGQYQLYVNDMQPDGVGALSLAFEQVKEKLAAEGLFLAEHKKALPRYPKKIGVITSPTGAAVRDILQVAGRRWPLAEMLLCPVQVQGDQAAQQLRTAVEQLDRAAACDVIIIGRGGGSMEDLQAFNDEGLARAIFSASIPVISAVGHETDFSICDFVADLRAPTSSAAAELATPDGAEEQSWLRSLNASFHKRAMTYLATQRQALDLLHRDTLLAKPEAYLQGRREKLQQIQQEALRALKWQVLQARSALSVSSGKLDSLSPLKILSRGYAAVFDEEGKPIKSLANTKAGDQVTLRMADGARKAEIKD